MSGLLSVEAFFISAMIGLVIFSKLRAYRIDLKAGQDAYEGKSKLSPVNYLSRANYSRNGHPLLELFWVWHILMLALLIIIVDYSP